MKKSLEIAALLLIVFECSIGTVNAQTLTTETILYSFQSGTDGALPYDGLLAGASGVFYGTTGQGGNGSNCGTTGCGTVFRLANVSGTWTESVLHAFNNTDGSFLRYGSLISDAAGNLYGATYYGGAHGRGVVFELSPPPIPNGTWTEMVLHSFAGGSDGANPNADLILDANGNLFGTTQGGGGHGSCLAGLTCGVFFELTPPPPTDPSRPWTETILFDFKGGSSGGNPNGLIASGGNFFGTTYLGGKSASSCNDGTCGVVFKLSKDSNGNWLETVLYSFAGGSDGANPNDKLHRDASGNLFGTTSQGGGSNCLGTGCGTVFEVSPPTTGTVWTETLIHVFGGTGDGIFPLSPVIGNGSGDIFGTTGQGGGTNCGNDGISGCGIVFKLTPPVPPGTQWTETILHKFRGGVSDGAFPTAGLVLVGGKLYGTTVYGGGTGCSTQFLTNPGCGTVYQLQ
ncbi:MAG TPA: choice-of-anchor tandem repeat GloVer-containing protein [Candidatus Angelobacter sp.]